MCGLKAGLSLHERRVHAADYHSCLTVGHRIGNKRRWTHEERVLLAQEEVRIRGKGMREHSVNSRLSLVFPDRTSGSKTPRRVLSAGRRHAF